MFVVCFNISLTGSIPVMEPGTTTLAGAIVAGTVHFITIVLVINRVVISHELGWTGRLQERFEGMTTLRRVVEHRADIAVSSTTPTDILQPLMLVIAFNTETLQADSAGETAESVGQFVRSITG